MCDMLRICIWGYQSTGCKLRVHHMEIVASVIIIISLYPRIGYEEYRDRVEAGIEKGNAYIVR